MTPWSEVETISSQLMMSPITPSISSNATDRSEMSLM